MSPNGQSGLADTSAYLFAFAASTASREEGRVLVARAVDGYGWAAGRRGARGITSRKLCYVNQLARESEGTGRCRVWG
jgi:hypothetical protein